VTGLGFLECLTHGNNRLVHDSLAAELDMMLNQTQMKGMAVQDEHNKWLKDCNRESQDNLQRRRGIGGLHHCASYEKCHTCIDKGLFSATKTTLKWMISQVSFETQNRALGSQEVHRNVIETAMTTLQIRAEVEGRKANTRLHPLKLMAAMKMRAKQVKR